MKKKSIEFKLVSEKRDFPIVKIRTSNDAYQYAKNFYSDDIDIYESSFIILVNQAHNAIGYAKISQGGINGTVVDPRIICKYAIDSLCSAVILIHNHPSGNLHPSREDDNLTKSVKQCLEVFNIQLLDHMILSDCGYYSYSEECRI